MITSFVDSLRKINIRCSEFVSQGVPLYKTLPTQYGDIDRVKVRFRREPIFGWLLDDLTQFRVSDRYVRARTNPALDGDGALYYVFPINGARVVWSHTTPELSAHLAEVASDSGDISNMPDMRAQVVDQLRNCLTYDHWTAAVAADREVFVYNIADFYVVRTEACGDYSTLVEAITSSTIGPIRTTDL